ncbi:MAG: hypothetical protein OXN89_22400 [Bryobacterales bacterium]|nr:hypothetical protein [Bryobacterales bacterium]
MIVPAALSRRHVLLGLGAATLGAQDSRPRVAAVVTEFRHRSHADVICTRILDGYYPNGRRQDPKTRIVSMYTDQVPVDDMSRGLAHRKRFSIYPTIEEALTLRGDRLAVDAVLLIGEHGDYPVNGRGQKLYPRHRLFREIAEVFRSAGRVVPVFCDKHLSYSWDEARQMYDWARELRVPFMAGSSIPVTVRTPELAIPSDATIKRAVQTGYGPLDSYGFHTLESLQCMVERRSGGETGVASVEMLEGDAVWRWRDGPGGWSKPLLDEALAQQPGIQAAGSDDRCAESAVFVLKYRDGLEAAAYMLNNCVRGWNFAAEIDGRILSTHFGQVPQTRDLPHFDGLTHCIEELFVSGRPIYPVERTLLTTGVLAFLFESRERKGKVDTPELGVTYSAPADTYFQRS